MRTVLIISRYFPPAFQIGGKRAYRFARYLEEYGWRAVVWTGPIDEGVPTDPTPIELPESVTVDRTLLPSWWPEPKSRRASGTDTTPSAAPKRGIWKTVRSQVAIPVGDEMVVLPRALRRLRKLVRRHRPDVVFATSSPYWILALGVGARAANALPVCLDLRDPWSMNFLQDHKAGWIRRAEEAAEERYFRAADAVTLTCQAAADAYRERYPQLADRFHTIYNAFDPTLEPPRGDAAGQTRLLVHFGNCYGPRRLAPVLRGLAHLKQNSGAPTTRLVNLGKPNAEDLELAARLGIDVEVAPFVPLDEGLRRLSQAAVQLLLAYGDEPLFVPAKLYDYLLSGAPILAVGGSSEMADIVASRTRSGIWVSGDDPGETGDALRRLIDDGAPDRDQAAVDAFSAPHTTAQLAGLLDDLVP